jgi:hypothetical protein
LKGWKEIVAVLQVLIDEEDETRRHLLLRVTLQRHNNVADTSSNTKMLLAPSRR